MRSKGRSEEEAEGLFRAAQLLDEAKALRELPPPALRRVRARIEAERRQTPWRRGLRHLVAQPVTLALVLVAAAAAAALAPRIVAIARHALGAHKQEAPLLKAPPAKRRHAVPAAAPERPASRETAASAPAVEPEAEIGPPQDRVNRSRHARSRELLAQESRLLARALRQLRSERNPRQALATLAQYRRRFPAGMLSDEADLARLDALLALDRRGEALALLRQLEGRPLGGRKRAGELGLMQAELRAEQRSCADALPIFEKLLARSSPRDVAERALYHSAWCRGRLGLAEASQREYRRYLGLYPTGRFAARARKALVR